MEKTVIIPRFSSRDTICNYIPNFVKIHVGDTIRWINKDTQSHTLIFYGISEESSQTIFIAKLGPIEPEQSMAIIFNDYYFRIDYFCETHKNEINYIIFLTTETDDMSNTERLRYLGKKFSIIPPDFMSNLDSKT
jgi:hypothetical protein